MSTNKENDNENSSGHFINRLINEELQIDPFDRKMCTRFPPEPNGYLHIGSAYAIHTNYAIARQFNGIFHLRFDDTNPLKEDMEYVNAIAEDIKWLGYDPGEHIYFGSDYSTEIYKAAMKLIQEGKAYVCDLSPEEVVRYRGTLITPGKDSPYRGRSPEENLELFERMRQGEFPAGGKVLRAKIDMASPNPVLRDPVIYRIIHAPHYRTGKQWCIYPMYDFAHPIQDAIEGITYSLCSIEFKSHRPLYEWVLSELTFPQPPRQREFGRLNVTGVVTSKRFLRLMVEEGHVDGWDDPRLPTLRGLRRRGFTPESITGFIEAVGNIRTESTVDISLLDHCLRQDLKDKTTSIMAVLNPLKVVITNYPEGGEEWLSVENNSENDSLGKRVVPFSKTLFIEKDDFMEHPVKGFHRLAPGSEVRLKGAYFIKCENMVKNPATGEVTELHCTYDHLTKSGTGFSGRKVKGTIHWVSGSHAIKADVNLLDKLLLDETEDTTGVDEWRARINPASKTVIVDALIEPFAKGAAPEQKFQFIRQGYFCVDSRHSTIEKPVFNRIVPLKDSWGKKAKEQ
ncbi:glutamine--tRNA ligase/YqeY domain fusion protein [Paenibacillus sp. CAU 1782]